LEKKGSWVAKVVVAGAAENQDFSMQMEQLVALLQVQQGRLGEPWQLEAGLEGVWVEDAQEAYQSSSPDLFVLADSWVPYWKL
jgi:hypothetical protein